MKKNKFYLLTTPLLFIVALPFSLLWDALQVIPPVLVEFVTSFRRAWAQATWI